MISQNKLAEMLTRIKQLSGCELGLWDSSCNKVYATDPMFDDLYTTINNFNVSNATAQDIGGVQYIKVREDDKAVYTLLSAGADAALTARLTANQIEEFIDASGDKLDKDSFVRDLLLDNLLLVDITSGATKLRIESDRARCVYIVEGALRGDITVIENAVRGSEKSSICLVEDGYLACIKNVEDILDSSELEEYAVNIQNAFAKAGRDVRIGYGTIADSLKDISHSYKEAHMAIQVGKIFFEDSRILSYSNLGIGRLIYQLPVPLCKMFIGEIFEGITPDEFDEETLTTISKFFENSLNVSETSRQLFIHRNTLVYRLDKIQKMTGLDLRIFDDAITFKIALLVVKYMRYVEEEAF